MLSNGNALVLVLKWETSIFQISCQRASLVTCACKLTFIQGCHKTYKDNKNIGREI